MASDNEIKNLYRLAVGETGENMSSADAAQGATGTATIETADNDRTFSIFGALGQPLP